MTRLIITHPGHFPALKDILEVKEAEGLNEVEEVFMGGSPEVMGSGRGVLHAPQSKRYGNRPNMRISTV